ncbi:MAG TPA: hypothetical protein VF266_22590, partial [Thermoanaerobaculia bacterium]
MQASVRFSVIVVIVATALAVVFGPPIARWIFPPKAGIAALTEASHAVSYRTVEGRLSGGFAYKPFRESVRADDVAVARLDAVASRIRLEDAEGHAGGVASLLKRDDERAVALLEKAVRRKPDNPFVISDLSAAYHTRALVRDHAPDHVAALDAAERAWHQRQTPETAWNRAVAISALHLAAPARRAWEDVLRLEADPGWRLEAQRRKAALEGVTEAAEWSRLQTTLEQDASARDAAIRRLPARALGHFEDELLPRWAKAQLNNDAQEAARIRGLARPIARVLAGEHEHFAADTLEAIDFACGSSTR